MLNQLLKHVQIGRLFNRGTPLLVAISGGRDSMALLHGLIAVGCHHLEVAHMNFGLRGEESDGDEQLVSIFCQERGIMFHSTRVDTTAHAAERKLSIQMAARDLRYDWLESLRKERNLHFIVTAHHLDDQAETILFNIIQGTGMDGLKGMTLRSGSVIRPLLEVERAEIDAYVSEHQVPFREDSSNEQTHYRRNFIRHKILPLLKELNPAIVNTLGSFGDRMHQAGILYHNQVELIGKKVLVHWKEGYKLHFIYLLQHPAGGTLLYEMLHPFGASPDLGREIMLTISGAKKGNASGQQFLTSTHRILVDKRCMYILPLVSMRQSMLRFEEWPKRMVFDEWEIDVRLVPIDKVNMKSSGRFAYLDADKIAFPLTIRYPEQGDYFYPFGMDKSNHPGKVGKKKLSKFFKDIHLPLAERECTPILFSAGKLMWVLGLRIDDRFKVTAETRSVVILSLPQVNERG